jgi:hypothetical protein
MGVRRNNLDIFFHHVPPGYLLNSLIDDEMLKKSKISHSRMDEGYYFRLAAQVFPRHTEDEHRVFFHCAQDSMRSVNECCNKPSVFNMLYRYANDILLSDNQVPICRYEKILNWRDMSLRLGQDLFTCFFFAYRDAIFRTNMEIFSWPAVINTDNERLHKILHKGLAENHFHLLGSSRMFEINWMALMNHESEINRAATEFKQSLNNDVLERTAYQEELTWRNRLKQAAIIRSRLFGELMGGADVTNDVLLDLGDTLFSYVGTQGLRLAYGYQQPDNGFVLDYALTKFMHDKNYNHNRALVGERFFLYQCFKQFCEDKFSELHCDLLYLYLLIKSKFRGEMVQRNQRIGFKNFSDYQNRKSSATKHISSYVKEQVRLTVEEVVAENTMLSFETRITPRNTVSGMRNLVSDINKACGKMDAFFYVLHFPKVADKKRPDPFITKCRNHSAHQNTMRRAKAVAGLLNKYPVLRKIIRGVDGCSNEIGCRPEVMAHEFRFLSNFIPTSPILLFNNPEPLVIKKTYHVGEDFMDLIDGLRAIDEAILFLVLKRGDRLGHALALGIDSEEYYGIKNGRIALKKQDLMDNICWLLCRSTSLGISVPPKLRESLQRIYHEIARYVYEGYREADNMAIYYDAWHLRGDNPHLYRSCEYRKADNFINDYERWSANENCLFRYKESELLYYAYHFDFLVRQKGNEPKDFFVTKELIHLIEQMQYAMQRFVEKCGISIETNPTSNFLIAPISRFDRHPILRLYNNGLEWDVDDLRQSPQISVSINTDDQGVFDTNLENEYAVIANALERMERPDGNKKYSASQVYNWLDQIRQMGIEQSFKEFPRNLGRFNNDTDFLFSDL